MTPTTRRLRMGAALGAAALLSLTMAGCKADATGHTGTGHAAAGGTHSDGGHAILTGTRLNAMLLPASAMPAGLHLEADGARNTGESVESPSTAPVEPGKQCEMLLQTSWIQVTGIGPATFAENDYADSGHTQQVGQEIDVFHQGEASRVMAGLRKTFARCRSFTDRSNGMVAKVKIVPAALHGVGDDAFKATETSPNWDGGQTFVAIRQGDAIVTAFYSSSHSDKGAKVVTMARTIAGKVAAAS